MTFWRDEHAALLEAIRADSTVPTLIRRLTSPTFDLSAADARRWRAWAVSLRASSGGRHLLESAESSGAWPDALDRAEQLGFTPRSDHHNALLFGELFRRTADSDLELSRRLWGLSLRAWSRLEQTQYLDELGAKLARDSDAQFESVLKRLLSPQIEYLFEELKRSLQISADAFVEVSRERARWSWECLDDAAAMVGIPSPRALIETTRQQAIEKKAFVVATASTRFRRGLDSIDWADGSDESIVAPFRWLAQVCEAVGFRENLSTLALKEAIEGAWTLRRIERDGEPIFQGLIAAAEPFAEDLAERVTDGSAFGQGTRVADYLVFVAEGIEDPDDKRHYLERALEFSPSHRNASLLLSYVVLSDVERLLLDLTLSPAFAAKVVVVGDPLIDKVHAAWALCKTAEELYPFNRELDRYKERVREEADRFGVALPRDPSDSDE